MAPPSPSTQLETPVVVRSGRMRAAACARLRYSAPTMRSVALRDLRQRRQGHVGRLRVVRSKRLRRPNGNARSSREARARSLAAIMGFFADAGQRASCRRSKSLRNLRSVGSASDVRCERLRGRLDLGPARCADSLGAFIAVPFAGLGRRSGYLAACTRGSCRPRREPVRAAAPRRRRGRRAAAVPLARRVGRRRARPRRAAAIRASSAGTSSSRRAPSSSREAARRG
jgi:hypothetical protein